MGKRQGTRTSPAEVERLLRNQALILAEIDDVIVGSVNVNVMSEGVGEFGMLVADPDRRGKGIGSALIDRAENWARGMSWQRSATSPCGTRPWPEQSSVTWLAHLRKSCE